MTDTTLPTLSASAAVSGTDLLLSRQAGTSDTKTTVTQLMTYINANGAYAGSVIAGQYGGTGVANTGKTITVSGNTTIGSSTHTVAFATGGNTSVTLPASGTLATLAGSEAFSNKTFGSVVTPTSNDGAALGTGALSWSDLFLASGGVVNFNNGDVTITHAANQLNFAGATTNGYRFADGPIAPSTNDGVALGTTALSFSDMFLATGGVVNWNNGDVTITHAANQLTFAGAATNGYRFADGPIAPSTNDGVALGTSSLSFADLFLASGGVINWNNGNVTLTHSAGALALNSAFNISVPTTTIAATASIDAAAILGQDLVTWTPSGSTNVSGTFVTGKMRKTIVNTTNGAIVSPGHAIAGYDYLEFTGGTNTADLLFVHEAKYKKTGTATVNNISFYKPAIDTVAGTHVNITLFDGDMDLSGVTYTNAYLMNNANRSYLAFNTVGTITGATGNQVTTSVWPSMATGRAYFPRGYGSTGTAAYTQGLAVVGPPIVIPERTTVTKIGINVTSGVASSVARLGIYKMGADGNPTTLVLDAGTVTTATTGEREITISQVLEAGAYHLCYQSTGGVGGATISTLAFAPSFLGEVFGLTSGDPSTGSIDVMYVANTGVLPAPFGTPTKALIGAVPAVYLKK